MKIQEKRAEPAPPSTVHTKRQRKNGQQMERKIEKERKHKICEQVCYYDDDCHLRKLFDDEDVFPIVTIHFQQERRKRKYKKRKTRRIFEDLACPSSPSLAEKYTNWIAWHWRKENPLQPTSFVFLSSFLRCYAFLFKRLFLTCRKYYPPPSQEREKNRKKKKKIATLKSISDGKCYGVILFSSLLWGTFFLQPKILSKKVGYRVLSSIFKWYHCIYRFCYIITQTTFFL